MSNAFAMGLVQRIRNFDRGLQYLIERQRPFLQPFRKCLSFQIFHH